MHVVFGMSADGSAHPAHPGEGTGAIDAVVLGPAGMLDLLAGQLGLSVRPVPPVVRIAAWQAKLEAAAADDPRFYSGSLSADALSTARLLLSWRDALVEWGWTPGDTVALDRVADIAAAERATPPLPRGRPDLFREVRARLAAGEPTRVASVELIEGVALLPPAWQGLFRELSASGVVVSDVERPAPTADGGDLGRLKRYLAGGGVEALAGDGSLTLLESRTEILAAEAVADWMAQDAEAGAGTVFIVPDGDSVLLDHALTRRGLPALGCSRRTSQRGALQLLSLAFSIAWAPFDPQKLLELLLLPRPPLEGWAARLLADALAREPGKGGTAWTKAWDEIETKLAELNDGLPDPMKFAEWREWMDVGLHGRATGMPTAAAAAICGRVRRWALATDGGARDPLLLCAVGAADAMCAALDALGRPLVTAAQVEGLIDLAIAEGLPDPYHAAQEGGIRSVSRPGAIWDAASRVVWWGFSGEPRRTRQPWTTSEAKALAASGCEVETDARALRREAAHWEQAVRNATSALVFVTPSLARRGEVADHPLAHRMAPILSGTSREAVRSTAESLLTRGSVRIAGLEVRRRPEAATGLPEAVAAWELPPTTARAAGNRAESASSLQDLMECQFRWVLKYVARLRPGGRLALPGRERLLGNVAHALAQAVFPIGEVPDPVQVRRAAAAGVDDLLDRMAAPLRLPGSSRELAFARARIPESLSSLAALLSERGMAVVGMEVDGQLSSGPLQVRGRIDLLVRDRGGKEAIIDLKWTGSRTWRRNEVAEGRAVQLATYSRLVAPAGGASAGYYLLRQRELVAEAGSTVAREGLVVARSLDATWDAVVSDWHQLAALARSGKGLASGVPGVAEHLPANLGFATREGVCAFCDMRIVCRVTSEG